MIKEAEYYATVTIFECEGGVVFFFFPKVRRRSGSPEKVGQIKSCVLFSFSTGIYTDVVVLFFSLFPPLF